MPLLEENLEFSFAAAARPGPGLNGMFEEQLAAFREFGTPTKRLETETRTFGGEPVRVPTYVNEFWTARQRAACSLHEVSYRACFKPQLPRFFIERFSASGEVVYDPFMGRGTTVIEAALLGRVPYGCDVSPLSALLARPRLNPVSVQEVAGRLRQVDWTDADEHPEDLLVFYNPETLREICALKKYLLTRNAAGTLDPVDDWIRMIALNRLTGHSPGFFSVYTLPPNQATSVVAQRKINRDRDQTPPRRHVPDLLCRKTRRLLSECDARVCRSLSAAGARARLYTARASETPGIASGSVSLVVTSPPFLDVVDYAGDNWLRCWFAGIDPDSVGMTTPRKVEDWQAAMTEVFHELARVLKPGGHVAFEVGEVRKGTLKLEEAVLPCGIEARLEPVAVVINDQEFTKTAHCWGVDNRAKGTNTNRIVIFRK